MPTIDELKEQQITPTPLFLFECVFAGGAVERWATHGVSFGGHDYAARLLRHNLFELRASGDDGLDGSAKISLTLANADSHYSQIERVTGFKGAQVTVRFLFYDLVARTAASEARVVFRGIGSTPDEITEAVLRVTFANRFNLQRIVLPEVRIQRRCPWLFPSTVEQRGEALSGGQKGRYSAVFRCGYSAGLVGREGALDGSSPFTTCDYTRASCSTRGMFTLGRFGGIEFVPQQIQVRTQGEAGTHLSPVLDNQARYNDFVPIVYGTAWYEPPVVVARNDGNLNHLEVLLGMGEIDDVVKVIVNDIEIPEAVTGSDMTATGWYDVVTHGARSGVINPDFSDASGNGLGDPYGSMAMASVVVPNRIANGQSTARVKILLRGMKIEQFDSSGTSLGESFTRNPAWILLDVLRRSGWLPSEIDIASFASAAVYCEGSIPTKDLYGNETAISRYQCNLVVNGRKSAAELARGIRAGSSLMIGYSAEGLLALRVENTLALQQPVKPSGSNSVEPLNGGWPAYEFSDGSAAFWGILRKAHGEPSLRRFLRAGADTGNRLAVEFQDEYNEYQQDSLSLVDVDDALLTAREVTASFGALGLPNYDQATRVLELQLAKLVKGNAFIEFETSVHGVGLVPGDLITVTYLKEGLERQLFRVIKLVPGLNSQTIQITAQWHDDDWYTTAASAAGGRRRNNAQVGIPRPLIGSEIDAYGRSQFTVADSVEPLSTGEVSVRIKAVFRPPIVPATAAVNVPLVDLTTSVASTGGTLAGGQTFYYAVSAKDVDGSETTLSFAVRAKVPNGTNTNVVNLQGLSFSAGTESFNVYRGPSPSQVLLIAENQAVAASFSDTGLASELNGPPDENYDHANFYWRLERIPETSVGTHSLNTVGNGTLGLGIDDFRGSIVRITRGTGSPQERTVVSNTSTVLTVSPPWLVEPDATSYFTAAEPTWKFAGFTVGSPVEFQGPSQPGSTVHISGRAANVLDRESAYELSPVTRWQIGSGGGVDTDAPPAPVYGLNPIGDGTLELAGIGFTSFTNTYGISAGVLDLFWWNELNSPSGHVLASGINVTDAHLTLSAVGSPATPLIQIGGEILEVLAVLTGGTEYHVARGAQGSTAAVHGTGAPIYHLERTTVVIPFVRGFFGSPAGGSFRQSINLPDVRVGVANLYMINGFGNGLVGYNPFGGLTDQGLRTLSGGQVSIQVEGYLAIQDHAAPALVMDRSHSARDIFAVVREAPDGGDVSLTLRQNGTTYCTLTLPDGETTSNVVSGFGLPPLAADARLYLDITNAPGAPNTLPGRDLTVTIRL